MDIEALDLHHFGIVAGICDEIGLVKEINKLVSSDPQRKVSVGECVKAMIINGMGYTTRPMYLASQFFEAKPIAHLIKQGIEPKDLNDDTLGRALDKLFEKDCTKIFSHIALKAMQLYSINAKFRHFDTTNMQVHGEYEDQDQTMQLVSYGYAKHGRADLKQFLISLMVSNDSGIPLFQQTLPGNTSDTAHFKEVLKTMQRNITENDNEFYAILDSAFYCEESIQLDILWITHVPDKIKLADALKSQFIDLKHLISIDANYKYAEVCTWYANVNQRWLIVYSEMAHNRARSSIVRLVTKEKEEAERALKKIQSIDYACKEDAQKAIAFLAKKLNYHDIKITAINERQIFARAGRPTSTTPKNISYNVIAVLSEMSEEIKNKVILKSMFVLATNELDDKKLTNQEILSYYKDQNKVERGFRFLKDPLCLTSAVYLKNNERIIALTMIMCLCLLVYSLAERKLRKALSKANETIPNQVGKETSTPTMRWVFQMFEGVIIASVRANSIVTRQIINLSEKLKKIVRLLGHCCMQMYLLEPYTQ
jgi:transposase